MYNNVCVTNTNSVLYNCMCIFVEMSIDRRRIVVVVIHFIQISENPET